MYQTDFDAYDQEQLQKGERPASKGLQPQLPPRWETKAGEETQTAWDNHSKAGSFAEHVILMPCREA